MVERMAENIFEASEPDLQLPPPPKQPTISMRDLRRIAPIASSSPAAC